MSSSPKPPTLKDVAALAGVSKSLVSLVIHDSPKVSAASRQLVLDAIDELGYQPNTLARSLAGGASHLLGVVVDCRDERRWCSTARAVRARAAALGYLPLMMCCDTSEAHHDAADQLLGLRVDALVMVGCGLEDDALQRLAGRAPVATVGTSNSAGLADAITTDEAHGADLAIGHLASLGHERIVYFAGDQPARHPRTEGYIRAMTAVGFDPVVVAGADTEQSGADRIEAVLTGPPPRPTAVIAATDRAATGAILTARGRAQLPTGVSIVAFEDGGISRLDQLGATVVAAPADDLGTRAVDLVLRRVGADRDPSSAVLEPELTIGTTTGPIPVAKTPTGVLL